MDTTSFGDRIHESVDQIFRYVPALVGALIILFAGYLLARLLEKATEKLLRRVHFNRIMERGGVLHAVERSGSRVNPTRVAASVIFWFVMFAVLMVAANALGLTSLGDMFGELVSYIPSLIAAIVIIIVGIVLGDFVGGLIKASAGAIHGGPTLSRMGKAGVIMIAIFMALQELGVATDIVTLAFAILFGAIALAAALAFGLGNRELAGEVTRGWYERYKAERETIDRENAAMDAAERMDDFDAPPSPS